MKLQISLYGLKDEARVWNKLLFKTLNQHGLTETKAVPCLFVRNGMKIVCYVDDLFLSAKQESVILYIKRKLCNKIRLKDLGRPRCFFGKDLKWRSDGSLSISQAQLINKLLMDTGMEKAKLLDSTIDRASMVNKTDTTTITIDFYAMYRCEIGGLVYLNTET